MATLGGSTRSNGPHVAALPPAEANANSDGVIKDSFDKKMRLLPFCMCEQALTFTGPSDALGVEWANSKSALAVGTMKFLARTVHSGVIEDGGAHNQCADHYVTTFFMYAFLMKMPHLITPNIKVIGVTGIRSINALVSLCTQFEETENNELRWVRDKVGDEWEPAGFKSTMPSRNALVGKCIAVAMERFEARCHGDAAKVDELTPKLISLLKTINKIRNEFNPKPLVPAEVKAKEGNKAIAYIGVLTIEILHWEGGKGNRGLRSTENKQSKAVLAGQQVGPWQKGGDTQLALFCLSFPDKPLHTFLCRFMCASLNSVKDVKEKAEEMMANTNFDAGEQEIFIDFVKKATHCLGSTPRSLLGDGNNHEDQTESIRIFLESVVRMLDFLDPERQQGEEAEAAERRPQQEAQRRQAEPEEANVGDNPTVDLDDSVGEQREQQQQRQDVIFFFDAESENPDENNADQIPRRNGQPARVDTHLQHTTIDNKGANFGVFQLYGSHWRHLLVVVLGLILVFPNLRAFHDGIGGTTDNPPSVQEPEPQLTDQQQSVELTTGQAGVNVGPVETEGGVQEPAPKISNELQGVEPTTGQAGVNVGLVETEGGVVAELTLGAGELNAADSVEFNSGSQAKDTTKHGQPSKLTQKDKEVLALYRAHSQTTADAQIEQYLGDQSHK